MGNTMFRGFTAAALALATSIGVMASTQQKTIKDKIYTKAQADGAQETFNTYCAKCHIPEKVPAGKKPAPPLTGDKFFENWKDRTLGELMENIYTNMPNDGATTLSKEQTADLTALILQMNQMPEGDTPLKYDDSSKDIVIAK